MKVFIFCACIFSMALIFPIDRSIGQSYPAKTYTEFDGLPSNYILTGTQDQLGRLWFATSKGPCHFDGVRWTSFGTEVDLPISRQTQLLSYGENKILLAGANQGRFGVFGYDGNWKGYEIEYAKGIDLIRPVFRLFAIDGNPFLAASCEEYLKIWNLEEGKLMSLDVLGDLVVNKIKVEADSMKIILLHESGVKTLTLESWAKESYTSSDFPIEKDVLDRLKGDDGFNYILTTTSLDQYQGRELLASHAIDPIEGGGEQTRRLPGSMASWSDHLYIGLTTKPCGIQFRHS